MNRISTFVVNVHVKGSIMFLIGFGFSVNFELVRLNENGTPIF